MCDAGCTYAFVVHGHLDAHWSDWLGGLSLAHLPDGRTRLEGFVPDQAALYGLLIQMRDLGLNLCAVAPVAAAGFSDASR